MVNNVLSILGKSNVIRALSKLLFLFNRIVRGHNSDWSSIFTVYREIMSGKLKWSKLD